MIARFFQSIPLRPAALLLAGVIFASATAAGQDVTATAGFNPPQLGAGQVGQFSVTISGASSNPKFDLPKVAGLEMQANGNSSRIEFNNGVVNSSNSINYAVRATKPGTYTVPSFEITMGSKTITIPASTLQVTDAPVTPPTPSASDLVSLSVNVTRKDIYVGEKLPLNVTITWRPDSQPQSTGEFTQDSDAFEQVHLTKDAEVSDPLVNGQRYRANTWATTLTPLKAGPQTLHFSMPMEVTVPGQNNDPFNDPTIARLLGPNAAFGFGQRLAIKAESDPLELNVLSLPTEGKPENFTEGIGTFSIDEPSLSSTDLQVGVPVTLKLTVSGQGNFERLQAPVLGLSALWRSYTPKDTFTSKDEINYHGVKTFEYVLMPMSENITELPGLEFNFFNPETKSYIDLPLKPIPVKVRAAAPGQAPPPLPVVAAAPANPAKPELIGLHLAANGWQGPEPRVMLASTYFWAGQTVPAILFATLVVNRRRKLRLENDPAYARRLRARQQAKAGVERARAAAAKGQAAEFYTLAQRALQEAASHDRLDAAEALTWTEFDAHLAARGDSVEIRQQAREIFDAGDALRFGGFTPDQASLAAAAARLDGLVQKLLGRA